MQELEGRVSPGAIPMMQVDSFIAIRKLCGYLIEPVRSWGVYCLGASGELLSVGQKRCLCSALEYEMCIGVRRDRRPHCKAQVFCTPATPVTLGPSYASKRLN